MSSKEELVRKKIDEERFNRDKEQQLHQEEERLKAAALVASLDVSSPKSKKDESRFSLKPSEIDNEDWKKLLADYKKKYPDRLVRNNVLTFATKEDAVNFLTSQATSEPPRKFLATEIDQNGKPTGMNMFSCGNKKLYQGSLNDIQDQLKAELKQSPGDINVKQGLDHITRLIGSAHGYREALQQVKGQPLTPTEEQRTESSPPNPFSTRPKSP